MTKHDRAVLQLTRNFLKKGEREISIGTKVISHRKIVDKLRKEFPTASIKIHK